MSKQYRWNEGYHAPVDPNDAAKELESIRKIEGRLDPDRIVEYAAHKDNPLHPAFQWSDSEAASKYRRAQAANLVRNLRIVIVSRPKEEPRILRAYINTRTDAGFVTREQMTPDIREMQIRYTVGLAKSFRDRLADLKDVPAAPATLKAIDTFIRKNEPRAEAKKPTAA